MEKTPNLDNVAKRAAYLVEEFTKTAGVGEVLQSLRNPLVGTAAMVGSGYAGKWLGNRFSVDAPEVDTTLPEYMELEREMAKATAAIKGGGYPSNLADALTRADAYHNAAYRTNAHKASLAASVLSGGTLGVLGAKLMRDRVPGTALSLGALGAVLGAMGHGLGGGIKSNDPGSAPAMASFRGTAIQHPGALYDSVVAKAMEAGFTPEQAHTWASMRIAHVL